MPVIALHNVGQARIRWIARNKSAAAKCESRPNIERYYFENKNGRERRTFSVCSFSSWQAPCSWLVVRGSVALDSISAECARGEPTTGSSAAPKNRPKGGLDSWLHSEQEIAKPRDEKRSTEAGKNDRKKGPSMEQRQSFHVGRRQDASLPRQARLKMRDE